MSRSSTKELKPFISVIILIAALLGMVFCKMEVRRMGYVVLKLSQTEKKLVEKKRLKVLQLARLNKPSHVEKVAQSEFTLKKAAKEQIVLLTSSRSTSEKVEN